MGARLLSVNRLVTRFIFGQVGLEPADETRVTGDVAAGCKGERFVHQINAYLAGEGILKRRNQRRMKSQFRRLSVKLSFQVFHFLRKVFGAWGMYKGFYLDFPLFTFDGGRR